MIGEHSITDPVVERRELIFHLRVPHVCPGLANVGPGPKPRTSSSRKRYRVYDQGCGRAPTSRKRREKWGTPAIYKFALLRIGRRCGPALTRLSCSPRQRLQISPPIIRLQHELK